MAQPSMVGDEALWVTGTQIWSIYQRYYEARDNQTEVEGFAAPKLAVTQPLTLPIHCGLKVQQSCGVRLFFTMVIIHPARAILHCHFSLTSAAVIKHSDPKTCWGEMLYSILLISHH